MRKSLRTLAFCVRFCGFNETVVRNEMEGGFKGYPLTSKVMLFLRKVN